MHVGILVYAAGVLYDAAAHDRHDTLLPLLMHAAKALQQALHSPRSCLASMLLMTPSCFHREDKVFRLFVTTVGHMYGCFTSCAAVQYNTRTRGAGS